MTPEEARELLKNTTPGDEWYYRIKGGGVSYVEPVTVIFGEVDVTEDDAALIVAAPTLAAMIAGMRAEYAVQVLRSGEWQWSRDEDDYRWQDLGTQIFIADREHPDEETRIVRRYVTEPEEIS